MFDTLSAILALLSAMFDTLSAILALLSAMSCVPVLIIFLTIKIHKKDALQSNFAMHLFCMGLRRIGSLCWQHNQHNFLNSHSSL